MLKEEKVSKSDYAASALLSTVLFIFIYGYRFNSGDQEEHLPYVYKLLNPALYPNDYLVPFQVSGFTVRYYYAHLLALAGMLVPVRWAVTFFQALTLAVFSVCLSATAFTLSGKRSVIYSASLLGVVVFNDWTIGGNSLLDMQLTCNNFAMAAAAGGMFAAVRNRYYLAAVCCGVAALFQVLTGLQSVVLILVFAFTSQGIRGWRTILATGILFVICASPALVPVMKIQFGTHTDQFTDYYHYILFRIRNPHHYYPAFFPALDYMRMSAILAAGAIAVMMLRDKNLRRYFVAVITIVLAGCCVYLLMFEGLHVAAAGKTQWFKSTVWIVYWSVIPLSILIDRMGGKILLRLIYLPLIITFSVLLAVILSQIFIQLPQRFSDRYQFGFEVKTDVQRMHEYIRNNTPVDAVFITYPRDDSFLCEAQRSLVTGYKGIIHEQQWILNWYKTYSGIYHLTDSEAEVNLLQSADVNFQLNHNCPGNFDGYMLLETNTNPALPVIHKEGNLLLVKCD